MFTRQSPTGRAGLAGPPPEPVTVSAVTTPDGRPGRRVLLTAAGPGMRAVLEECSLPALERYAMRWGYAVRAVRLSEDGEGSDQAAQHAKWQKLGLLREALQDYDLAVWFDADVLVVRDDEDLARHLHHDDFHALALEHVPAERRVNPNTGVWVMRACPLAQAFLAETQRIGPLPGPRADQGAVLQALGWDRGDVRYVRARPGRGSRFLAATSWLPPGWNQPYCRPRTAADSYNSDPASYADRPLVAHPHAVHYMGMRTEARLHAMRVAAVEARGGRSRRPTVGALTRA